MSMFRRNNSCPKASISTDTLKAHDIFRDLKRFQRYGSKGIQHSGKVIDAQSLIINTQTYDHKIHMLEEE